MGTHGLVFNPETMTLLLDFTPAEESFVPVADKAETEGLSKKEEFHITVIGYKTGKDILKKLSGLPPESRAAITSKIESLVDEFPWIPTALDDYYLIAKAYTFKNSGKEERRSIIQTVELPSLLPFYAELITLLETRLDVPFPHVTLFTTSTNPENRLQGIGINSEEEFLALDPIRL